MQLSRFGAILKLDCQLDARGSKCPRPVLDSYPCHDAGAWAPQFGCWVQSNQNAGNSGAGYFRRTPEQTTAHSRQTERRCYQLLIIAVAAPPDVNGFYQWVSADRAVHNSALVPV
jgi:hypothetical protein